MIRAVEGDTVKVHYVGKLTDGTIFDKSPEDRPLLFQIGKGEVIAGFERGVCDMFQGEKKTLAIPPEEAYGVHKSALVEEVDRALIPAEVTLLVGHQLEVTPEEGHPFLVLITGLSDETVTIDGNHPLAGKDLHFDVELLEVRKKPLN
ncbi:MAG: FKBP-type peptidyl-prolyl cis-trans isomerase [Desulfuromonadaceae bacterium]|nr:FKBP-type peptidyl-prolyl cis-trans isomerase [Desulfuromonadaceae bacterium]